MTTALLSFQNAKQRLLTQAKVQQQTETILISDALSKIVAKPIISPISVPSFNNSAMDGYAVRLTDLAQNTTLPVSHSIFAGESDSINWPENTCIRIMTGAKVPDEADAVVMQEETEVTEQGVLFKSKVKAKQNIRYIGEDVKQGTEVIAVGQKLTIPMLSTLATLGINQITVFRPIRVALFSTGDELRTIGEPLASGQIYDSNRFTLLLMLKQLGCEVIDLGIIKDNPMSIKNTFLSAAKQADIVLTSGGVSVGDADYTKDVLNEIGEINFWKIAIKPGKPFAFGYIVDDSKRTLFCGLPGNPVSAIVTFYQLVQPLILKMSGLEDTQQQLHFQVKTQVNLKKSVGRLDFQRGQLIVDENNQLVVTSTGHQGSHITQSLSQANCFICLEAERGHVNAGEYVTVELFNHLMINS